MKCFQWKLFNSFRSTRVKTCLWLALSVNQPGRAERKQFVRQSRVLSSAPPFQDETENAFEHTSLFRCCHHLLDSSWGEKWLKTKLCRRFSFFKLWSKPGCQPKRGWKRISEKRQATWFLSDKAQRNWLNRPTDWKARSLFPPCLPSVCSLLPILASAFSRPVVLIWISKAFRNPWVGSLLQLTTFFSHCCQMPVGQTNSTAVLWLSLQAHHALTRSTSVRSEDSMTGGGLSLFSATVFQWQYTCVIPMTNALSGQLVSHPRRPAVDCLDPVCRPETTPLKSLKQFFSAPDSAVLFPSFSFSRKLRSKIIFNQKLTNSVCVRYWKASSCIQLWAIVLRFLCSIAEVYTLGADLPKSFVCPTARTEVNVQKAMWSWGWCWGWSWCCSNRGRLRRRKSWLCIPHATFGMKDWLLLTVGVEYEQTMAVKGRRFN